MRACVFVCSTCWRWDLTRREHRDSLTLPLDSTERLLEAAVSLRLVEKRVGGRFGLGSLGAALVGNPAVGAMIEHHRLLYRDLDDPVSLLRGARHQTELGRYWAYAKSGSPAALAGAQTDEYTALMANSQPLVAGEIFDAYPIHKHRCLLDVGGGDGTFLLAAAERSKEINLVLFDLPPVAERARQRFETLGLSGRARAVGGDFFRDELPEGADMVSLVRVVHDHNDADAKSLLERVHRALAPNGVVILAEPMMGTPGAETVGDAYFGFYLLAMGSGKPRTPEDLKGMLRAAGFSNPHLVRTHQPLQVRVMVASKIKTPESVKTY